FFFSSRRRHTRFSRDWSSDVCSSDLPKAALLNGQVRNCQVKRQEPSRLLGMLISGKRRTTYIFAERKYRRPSQRCESAFSRPCEIGRASCRERVKDPVVALAGQEKQA